MGEIYYYKQNKEKFKNQTNRNVVYNGTKINIQ